MNLHVDANEELKAAVVYYESCETGLGDEFFAEFLRGVEQIQQHPQAWPITYKDFRRYLIHRFPYALVYRDSGQDVFILAEPIPAGARVTGGSARSKLYLIISNERVCAQ